MPASIFNIRRAVPADARAVADLWKALLDEQAVLDARFRIASDAVTRWKNDFPEWIKADTRRIFVAVNENETVGFITAQPWYPLPIYMPAFEVYVNELYVVPAHRQQGIGQQLVEAIKGWAKDLNATGLRVGVLAQNAGGLTFWETQGAKAFSIELTI